MSWSAQWHARILRRPIQYLLASLATLLPCYWQPRVQAGDLSSHIYNAWLTTLIANGRAEGLAIVHQTTNVLFDVILNGLFQWLGAAWAQRLSVSLAVLIFVWGAFAFVSAVSGRPAWRLLPCLAILAYGWVFHMGFFNFYLSMGLCFWGLAAFWRPMPRRAALAVVVFGVAYTAHALPVLWALGLMAYSWISSRTSARGRTILISVTLALIVVLHFVVRHALLSRWSPMQLASATGADQVLVFDNKYGLVMAALLFLWAVGFTDLLRTEGGPAIAATIPLHWCVLTAAGIFILPSAVLVPGFRHALVYIGERMSLGLGVCLCALLGTATLRRVQFYPLVAAALIFFGFLFRDEWCLNRFEDRVDLAVARLPAGQRLVSPILDSDLRANALTHMIDRACVGRCYSYANYEPSTAQFRIRAVKPNPYVIADYGDSFHMQNGQYVFKESELPLYALFVTESGDVTVRPLKAGVASGISKWRVLQNRIPPS